jgi:adenylate kinase
LGKQGVGKGTYAQRFSVQEGIPTISTGELLRDEAKTGSKLGRRVDEIINRGELVPNDLMSNILEKRLLQADCKNGFILDGFPRNAEQADLMETILEHLHAKLDFVINFFASEKTLMERLAGRWQCKQCAKIYHTTNLPPKVEGKCDLDNADLYQREDDKPEAIKKRFAIYEEQTKPILERYRKKGILVEVNADRVVEAVLEDLTKRVKKRAIKK